LNRRHTIFLICLISVLVIGVYYIFFAGNSNTYDWSENFHGNSDQPYGLTFLRQLLESSHEEEAFTVHDKNPLHEFLEEYEVKEKTNYVYIGNAMYLGPKDRTALKDFIAAGNNAFISTTAVPDIVTDIYDIECGMLATYNSNRQGAAVLNLYHPTLRAKYGYKYSYRFDDVEYDYYWKYLEPGLFCDSTKNLTPLGYLEPQNVNFVRIPHGKGALYLHTNPIVFTNYFLIKNEQARYASAVFSHLDGKVTIWDEFEKMPIPQGEGSSQNPLYFIMQQPSLKYSWWILVVVVVIYVVFAAKRTQRVIPIREQKSNTSLEFMQLISALHYREQNHIDMARKKMKYFQYFVRSKFGIHVTGFSEETIYRIAEKSTVSIQDIRAIFNLNKLIEEGSGGSIDATRLVTFYNAIEKFYKQCK
jgi:hypothetical protein